MSTETFDINRKWLVKTSGRVIGPYRQEEILQLLLDKRIAPIDEIKGPETRWVFLREHTQFREIIQKYRDQESSAVENTHGGQNTMTETDVNPDLTPTPHPLHIGSAGKGVVPEIKSIKHDTPKESEVKDGAKAAKVTPHYGMLNDRRVIRRTESKTKLFVMSLLIAGSVLLLFSGYIYLNKKNSNGMQVLDRKNYKESAIKNKALGLYDLALSDYRKAVEKENLDLSSKLTFATLLMNVENNYLEANRIVDEIESEHKNLTPEYKSIIENIRGLAAMSEDSFAASEVHFKNALNFDVANEVAKINLVQLKIVYGKNAEAFKLIQDLNREGIISPIFSINKAFLLASGKVDNDKFAKMEQELGQINSTEFEIESHFLRAFFELKMNKKNSFESNLRKLFSFNPDLSRDHVRELGVTFRALEWSKFKSLCDEMIGVGGENSWAKALDIYCSYQKGDINGASSKADSYNVKFAKDENILAIYLFILYKTNRLAEAKAVIALNPGREIYLLNLVKSEMCLKDNNYNCAEEGFNDLYHRDADDIEALHGLARTNYLSKNNEAAIQYMQKGLAINDKFLPLLHLKEKLNE